MSISLNKYRNLEDQKEGPRYYYPKLFYFIFNKASIMKTFKGGQTKKCSSRNCYGNNTNLNAFHIRFSHVFNVYFSFRPSTELDESNNGVFERDGEV